MYRISCATNKNCNKLFFNRRLRFFFFIYYPVAWENKFTFNLALLVSVLVVNISKCFTLSCRQDFWSTGTRRPALDTMQNVTLITASEMNGYTMVDFKRLANSADPQDVAIMVRTRNYVLPHC